MPVTTFVTLIVLALLAGFLAVWSFVTLGVLNTVPVLIGLAALAVWGSGTVPADDDPA